MTSKTEDVLLELVTLLQTHCSALVVRNTALPEDIPDTGLIIVYDGDPGQSEQTLGGFDSVYYDHAIEIIVFVEEGDAASRDTLFDNLVSQIKTVFRTYPDLNQKVFGLTYDHPKTDIVPVVGGTAIKSAKITLRAEYEDPLH